MAGRSLPGTAADKLGEDYRDALGYPGGTIDPRKPADKQFNLEMLKAVKGTPWQPNPEKGPNADADRLPEPIAIEPVVAPTELPPQPGQTERLPTYRRMYIRQSDLEKFGYTGGCEACAAIREGRERQGINHNEK